MREVRRIVIFSMKTLVASRIFDRRESQTWPLTGTPNGAVTVTRWRQLLDASNFLL